MSSENTKIKRNNGFIVRFIEVCGSSQSAKVARLLNISYQAAKNYLHGRLPDSNVLITISKQTPYSIHWLLTGKGEKFVNVNLAEDTPTSSDHLRAFIRDECQKVVGEIISSVSVEDAQNKVIVVNPVEIQDEKMVDKSNTSSSKESQ